jgi:hypothetical protein
MCGVDRDEAMAFLGAMEEATSPRLSPLPLAGEVAPKARVRALSPPAGRI